MIVNIQLAEGLPDAWQHRIRRQVDFKLTSKAPVIRVLTIDFRPNYGQNTPNMYACTMQAQLADGTVEHAHLTGLPNMCIADSAARLSRAINRRAKNRAARWRSSAQSQAARNNSRAE